MKSKLTILIFIFTSFLANGWSGVVITGTNVTLGDGSADFADYSLTVFQDELAIDPTSIVFNVSGSTMTIVGSSLDEGSDWFLTSINQEFSEASITASAHPVFIKQTPIYQDFPLDTGLGDFYLGVNTGNSDGVGFTPRNIYGWAILRNDSGNLSLLDSAFSYGGSGIIVGTTNTVPEPSSCVFIATGFSAAFIRRNRKQN